MSALNMQLRQMAAHRAKITIILTIIIIMNCLGAFVLAMLYKQFPHRSCLLWLLGWSPALIRADTQRKKKELAKNNGKFLISPLK